MSQRALDAAVVSGGYDLVAALLDFEALPGRYPLSLREPRALFERTREVLRLACGRSVGAWVSDPLDAPGVQRAACFFVRMAMLRPGADHYTLLGLERGFRPDMLREHYRMLIRLTHPDFPAGHHAWPAGAATRINLAKDVLSSRARKAEYDELLALGARRRVPVNCLAAVLPRPKRRGRPPRWVGSLASLGMAALGFSLMQWPHSMQGAEAAKLARVQSLAVQLQPAQAGPDAPALGGQEPAPRPTPSARPSAPGKNLKKSEAQGAKAALQKKRDAPPPALKKPSTRPLVKLD